MHLEQAKKYGAKVFATIGLLLVLNAPLQAQHPIFGALANGNIESVREQVTNNPDLVKAKDEQGRTLLHVAAARQDKALVVFLIERGAEVQTSDNNGVTPLHSILSQVPRSVPANPQAAREIVLLLLEKGADVNSADKSGRTPLYRAMESGQVEAVKLLRERGAKDSLRELFSAVQASDRAALEKLLLADARLANAADTQGLSPLHQAVRWRDLPLASLLLDNGANVHLRNLKGETPLHLAIASRQLEMVRLLIERGGLQEKLDDKSEDKNQARPDLQLAKSLLLHAYEAGDTAILSLLIEKGADLSSFEPRNGLKVGDFLLAEAATAGDLELAKRLIEKGAKTSHRQILKRPIQNGDLAMTQLLLDNGALPSGPPLERDSDGGIETPLHWAVRWKQKPIVELLLARGADAKRTDHRGQTPLGTAINGGDYGLAQLLLDKGAAKIENDNWVRSNLLEQALATQDRAFVELLIKNGVSHPNPLIDAVVRGDKAALQSAHAKIAQNADNQPRNALEENISALHVAALLGQSEMAGWLLENGLAATLTTRTGQTPLHWAALSGDAAIVKLLLEKGADPNARDKLQQTPLHGAALKAGREIIFALLDKGAGRDATLSSGFERPWAKGTTPLLRAAWAGNFEAVAALLERGADPNASDESGLTPLLAAAQARDAKSLALLLDKGVKLDQTDRTKRNALHYAVEGMPVFRRLWSHPLPPLARVDDARPALTLLLERGAKLGVRDAQLRAPLDLAVQAGNVNLVTFLLDKGAALNVSGYVPVFTSLDFPNDGYKMPGREGATPLHQAVFNGDKGMVELLLKRGADKNAEDAFGRTPLDIAERRGRVTRQGADFPFAPGLISISSDEAPEDDDNLRPPLLQTRKGQIAALLRAAGARGGKGPFFEAVRNGATFIVRQMLKENPSLAQERMGENSSTNNQGGLLHEPAPLRGGSSALSLAMRGGYVPIVEALLIHGAAKNAQATPSPGQPDVLHEMARTGNLAMVRLLLDNGFSVAARDNQGKTPLHLAALSGSEELVSFLLERGADINARDNSGLTPLNDARLAPTRPGVSAGTFNNPIGSVVATTRLPDGSIVQSNGTQSGGPQSGFAFPPGVATLLSSKGARLGRTYYSIFYENDVAGLTALLDSEPNLAKQRGSGPSLLHLAAELGKPTMMELLLARGADPNALGDGLRTPLHIAIAKNARGLVELLLEKGANVNLDPDAGQPEQWSVKNTANGPVNV
ncbi:MAG TPA: ankyrin repeat domain-containing protein, partial [Abditibacteriaceae bacterium]